MKIAGKEYSDATEIDFGPDYYYDSFSAEIVISFFHDNLKHIKGHWAGQPFILSEWQIFVIKLVFGWMRKSDNTRKHRMVYIEIGKKNGKSMFAAGIALFLTCADGETGAEVYGLAGDIKQAKIVHTMAKEMREKSPDLKATTTAFKDIITHPSTNSRYEAMSSNVGTKDGPNVHGLIFDELHAQKDRELYEVMAAGVAARLQPLHINITTAGRDRTTICWEEHTYAKQWMNGDVQDNEFVGLIYGAEEDDDWRDPKVWAKANPGLGETVQESYLRGLAKKAEGVPAKQNNFKRLHLNIWTESDDLWLETRIWKACERQLYLEDYDGLPCFLGLDLASVKDIVALNILFPPNKYVSKWSAFYKFYLPHDSVYKQRKRENSNYIHWASEGYLSVTPGNVCDYEYIRKDINKLGLYLNIKEIGIDKWNATNLSTNLIADGHKVISFSQTFSDYSAPMKELERLILKADIINDSNPITRWMIANTVVYSDTNDNIRPSKISSLGKIDAVPATLMSLGRAMHPDNIDSGPSVYDSNGVGVITL